MSYYTPNAYPSTPYRGNSLNGTLDTSKNLSLRKIDAAAIITCLLLLRLAFSPSNISTAGGGGLSNFADSEIGASIELAFYSPFKSRPRSIENAELTVAERVNRGVARPVPIDIDGDGIVDALALPTFLTKAQVAAEKEAEASQKPKSIITRKDEETKADPTIKEWGDNGSWGLRILNLKPFHLQKDEKKEEYGPFAPRSMFLSPLSADSTKKMRETAPSNSRDGGEVYPVKMLAVQIPVTRTRLGEEERSRQRHKKDTGASSHGGTGGYGTNSAIPPKDDANKDYDRTRHYFCGRDWHHASQSCHRHCASGTSTDCGDGEQCYADTPCDAMLPLDNTPSKDTTEETDMALTVKGTLPGISTVWSDGSVTLHVITADVISATSSDSSNAKHDHRGKRERQRKKKPELEMRQLWRVFPLDATSSTQEVVTFDELGLAFESGVIYGVSETSTKDNDGNEVVEKNQIGIHGAILFGGRYTPEGKAPKMSFHALDSMTGAALWDLDGSRGWSSSSKHNNKSQRDTEFPIPIIHTTSSARRRSHLPVKDAMDPELDNENSFVEGDDVMSSEECMAHFRSSVFDEANGALPHEFWDGEYGSLSVGRFERAKKPKWKKPPVSKKSRQLNQKDALVGRAKQGSSSLSNSAAVGVAGLLPGQSRSGVGSSKSWQTDFLHRAIPQRLINRQKYNDSHPRMGKPNVVMFHGRDGLAVLSLKNGRPVCHLSLIDNALYADMDRDGVVDVVQVVTSPEGSRSGGIQNLIQRINKSDSPVDNRNGPVVCHALVTSGLPPREEVFTAPLCLGGPLVSVDPKMPQSALWTAPPLLVEGSLGFGNDVVFAMNNGVVVRYDSNGREVWRKKHSKDGTPSWHSARSAFLGRVQFGAVKSHSSVSASSHRNQHRPGSPVRPILLSGEDGAALISISSGKVLSNVVYPQTAIAQPLLADLNGDGTDDLVMISADAIWGYRVVVETGRSGMFSIVVVTLVVCVALSALVQKTSQTSRRSMDA